MNVLRVLKENWIWWFVPLVVTLAATFYLSKDRTLHEPVMPLTYDLPTSE
jgi:hypothetical protein